ncbi:MAG: hypothetical protein JO199_01980 [Candidatus Eremiobacteraeota bacterium]|nr:hypothetical protein [Candidatus Eremiobacteraeota bacterium]
MTDVAPVFAPWSAFFTVTGSAGAALTGLTFVAITLIKDDTMAERRSPDGIATFTTPIVVYFGAAFLIATIALVPWRATIAPALLLGAGALAGLVYGAVLFLHAVRLENYRPDAEDWTWHSVLPIVAYVAVLASAIALGPSPANALFPLAGASVLFVVIGIHNAWDIVTWITVKRDQ